MAPLDVEEFTRWRVQADRARRAAEETAAATPEWSCFLYEQSAQLLAKGLLHATGYDAWGHDLTVLVRRADADLAAAWPQEIGLAAERLTRHYIPARYPDAHPSGAPGDHYSAADVEQAAADCAALHRALLALWAALGGPA